MYLIGVSLLRTLHPFFFFLINKNVIIISIFILRSTGGRDMHIHAEHNGVKFNCTICFKEFKRKGSLDRHMTGVHKTVSKAKHISGFMT